MLSVILIAGAIAMFLSYFRSDSYRSVAGVRVDPLALERVLDPALAAADPPAGSVETAARLVRSPNVEALVTAELGEAPAVSSSRLPGTDVIEIRAEAATGGRAAQVATAYATAFTTARNQELDEQADEVAAELQQEIDALSTRVVDLAAAGDEAARAAAATEQESLRNSLESLDARRNAGDLVAAEIVVPAETPTDPISTRPLRTGGMALVAGLFVGSILALLLNRFDRSVRSAVEVESVTTFDVLACIPEVVSWKVTSEALLAASNPREREVNEAYEQLAKSVAELTAASGSAVIEVTSPSTREGKTATVANLGAALARAGVKVMVVGADLRKPRLHQFFGLDNSVGLTSVVLGKVPLSAALQPVAGHPGLVLLASGPLPPKPAELLASERIPEVLRSLTAHAEVVLVDVPPALSGIDAVKLAESVDEVLLVCAYARTDADTARRAAEVLVQVGTPVMGAILNGTTPTR